MAAFCWPSPSHVISMSQQVDKQKERKGKEHREEEEVREEGRFFLEPTEVFRTVYSKPTSYVLGNCNSDESNDSSEFKQLVSGKNLKCYWENIFQLMRNTDFLTNIHPCFLDVR